MNSLKKKMALGLSLLMIAGTMSACGGSDSTADTTAAAETTAAETTAAETSETETTVAEPAVLNPDGAEVVVRLNDELYISYGALCVSVLQQKEYFESMTLEYYNTTVTVEDWNTPMDNGKTPAQDIFDQTLAAGITQLVVASKADEYQVSISEEELAALKEENTALYGSMSGDWLEISGLVEEDWLELSKQAMLYDKVKAAELANYTAEIADEDARTMKMAMFAIALDAANPGTGLPTQEEAEAKVQEILAIIEGGANPQSVVEEYGYTYYEDSIYVGQYTDEDSLKMLELKTGETMYFMPDETAVCAVICLDEADASLTEERKAVLSEEAAEKYFVDLAAEWVEAAAIEQNEELIGKMDLFSE